MITGNKLAHVVSPRPRPLIAFSKSALSHPSTLQSDIFLVLSVVALFDIYCEEFDKRTPGDRRGRIDPDCGNAAICK